MIMRTPGLDFAAFENSRRNHQILILGVGARTEEHLVDVGADHFADWLRIFDLVRAGDHRLQPGDVNVDIPLVDGIRIGQHRTISRSGPANAPSDIPRSFRPEGQTRT